MALGHVRWYIGMERQSGNVRIAAPDAGNQAAPFSLLTLVIPMETKNFEKLPEELKPFAIPMK